MRKLLLIDNYDSFTYNLKQLIIGIFYGDVIVKRNDEIDLLFVDENNFSGIIISPGPKKPVDSGISNDIINRFYKELPILGVCLGMQCINEVFGGKTVKAPLPVHGKISPIEHIKSRLFKNIPQKFEAARYHSLIIQPESDELIVTACAEDNIPMAIEHRKYPLFGVQFHPESFMTDFGTELMQNYLEYAV